jgi:hypothetical protein
MQQMLMKNVDMFELRLFELTNIMKKLSPEKKQVLSELLNDIEDYKSLIRENGSKINTVLLSMIIELKKELETLKDFADAERIRHNLDNSTH